MDDLVLTADDAMALARYVASNRHHRPEDKDVAGRVRDGNLTTTNTLCAWVIRWAPVVAAAEAQTDAKNDWRQSIGLSSVDGDTLDERDAKWRHSQRVIATENAVRAARDGA